MPALDSRATTFTQTRRSGSRNMQLQFIWANEMGGVAQAVIATFQDDDGAQLKQFTVLGPFSESGSARKAVIAKADAWFAKSEKPGCVKGVKSLDCS